VATLVVSSCIGSSIHLGLMVAPLLVLISLAMGQPMSLAFPSVLDLFAIASAVVITKSIATDGESSWFEGLMLVSRHVMPGTGVLLRLVRLIVSRRSRLAPARYTRRRHGLSVCIGASQCLLAAVPDRCFIES
jgi:hypothetical protein